MSILIKGLHMPDEDHGCPFVDVEYGYCLVDLGVTGNGEYCERMEECPLIELPDHGRLVDADEVIAESRCGDYWWETEEEVPKILNEIPTIIPAERKGEENV